MSTFTKRLLDSSVNGKPIQVVATTPSGTLLHTAVAGTSDMDEVWMWATNVSGAAYDITVEFGSTGLADNIGASIPSQQGLYLLVPGLIIQNSLPIRAYAGCESGICIHGFVNRISS